ncbi:unnamed protein product, partial [Mesorhabditis spiculigera]
MLQNSWMATAAEQRDSSPDEAGGGSEMAAGIMSVVQPSVEALDRQIVNTKRAQAHLNEQIELVSEVLHGIGDDSEYDLLEYVNKVEESKKRINRSGAVLEKIHDRLSQLQRDIARQIHKEKTDMHAPAPAPPKR